MSFFTSMIGQSLSGYSEKAEEMVRMAKIEAKWKEDQSRKKVAKKLKNYYRGEQTEYLTSRLRELYPPQNIEENEESRIPGSEKIIALTGEYNPITIPLVGKVAYKSFRVYKNIPKRSIQKEGKEIEWKESNFWYSDDYNFKCKDADRLKGLMGTILERIYWDPARQQFGSVFYTPDEISVVQNPYYPQEAIAIKCDAWESENTTSVKATKKHLFYVWFHPDYGKYYPEKANYSGKMYLVDGEGEVQQQWDTINQEWTNELKIIWCWIVHREALLDSGDFFNPIDESFVNLNEAINVDLTRLERDIRRMFGVQLGMSGSRIPDRLRVGDDFAINLGVDGSLSSVDMSKDLNKIVEAIRSMIKTWAWAKNVSVQESLDEAGNVSGFSLIVRNLDTLEVHEDRQESARVSEKERFKIMKEFQKAYKLPVIPEGDFQIDFAEINFPIDPTQEILQIKGEVELYGFEALLNGYMKWNQDLTREEAEASLLESHKKMKEISSKPESPNWWEAIFGEKTETEITPNDATKIFKL